VTADPELVETPEEAPSRASRAAGGCVLAGLSLMPLAVVFAVSPDAGILTTCGVGTAALWRAVRRPVSDSSATPPPLPEPPSGDVFAGETDEIDRVERGPEGVICIVHPKRVEVSRGPAPTEA
jgi:hypothetical protein